MPDKTKRILHRWVWVLAALAVLSLLIYAFAPIQLRFWARGLSGETLYEGAYYQESGRIYVLYDEEEQTLSLADTWPRGLFNVRKPVVYCTYDLAAGELTKLEGYTEMENMTYINRADGSRVIEFVRQMMVQRGMDLLTYGIYTDYQYPITNESLLYKEQFGDVFVYVTYFYDIGLGVM